MSAAPFRHVAGRVEQGVLVLTILETQLQEEKVADSLLQELLRLLDEHQADKVVVDFHRIQYVSSVAFRPLLHLRRRLQERGGRLVLCCLSKVIGDVFYTTRLVSTEGSVAAPFELAPTVAEAVARLSAAGPGT
jgi:anti-anti-sigma factor